MSVRDRLNAALSKRPWRISQIEHDPMRWQVASETAAGRRACVSVSWQEITTATASKRDLVTTDLLCLAFQTGSGKTLESHEEMSGWTELMAELPSYLPGCMTEAEILARAPKPAFATNATRIVVRAELAV